MMNKVINGMPYEPPNAMPFDPKELRWCVFGTNPKTGKTEYLETVDKRLAEMALAAHDLLGWDMELKQMERGEIRRRFGNPDWVEWRDKDTNERLFITT